MLRSSRQVSTTGRNLRREVVAATFRAGTVAIMENSAQTERMSEPASGDVPAHAEYNPVEYRTLVTRIEGPPSAATLGRMRESFLRLDSPPASS